MTGPNPIAPDKRIIKGLRRSAAKTLRILITCFRCCSCRSGVTCTSTCCRIQNSSTPSSPKKRRSGKRHLWPYSTQFGGGLWGGGSIFRRISWARRHRTSTERFPMSNSFSQMDANSSRVSGQVPLMWSSHLSFHRSSCLQISERGSRSSRNFRRPFRN